MKLSGFKVLITMVIKSIIFAFLITSSSCKKTVNDFDRTKELFQIEEDLDWVLIVNTPSCKTCLHEFYQKLNEICPPNGKIIIVSKSEKLVDNTIRDTYHCFDIIVDLQGQILKEPFFGYQYELVLLKKDEVIRSEINEYHIILVPLGFQ